MERRYAVGAVILLTKENRADFGQLEAKLAATASGFLGKQLEFSLLF